MPETIPKTECVGCIARDRIIQTPAERIGELESSGQTSNVVSIAVHRSRTQPEREESEFPKTA